MLLNCILQKAPKGLLVLVLLAGLCAQGTTAYCNPREHAVHPGIIHEEITTTQRPAQALHPLTSSAPRQTDSQEHTVAHVPLLCPDQDAEMENLLQHMDVYALSDHAHLLALPRMVSPRIVMEAAQGRYHLPTQAQWQPIIKDSSRISGLDPWLIAAVIAVESGNNPAAISPKGAQGLMQLMPATQAYLGLIDPFDPQANVRAGSLYLKEQLDLFGSLELALAAYNAGPGNVQKYKGIPPFAETKNFIHRVLSLYLHKDRADQNK